MRQIPRRLPRNNQYLAEAYLYVPSQGLEELKSWWNRELSEYQEITGHYPTQEETTTLIRQALSECSYSLDLDPLPEGEDFVEYFVLHQKKDSARILPAPLCCCTGWRDIRPGM